MLLSPGRVLRNDGQRFLVLRTVLELVGHATFPAKERYLDIETIGPIHFQNTRLTYPQTRHIKINLALNAVVVYARAEMFS